MLMPPRIADWLPDEHLARFVVEIVEQLDISDIRRKYAPRGGTPYSPYMMCSLLFYGYATGVFSSRKLERATYDSVAFRFVTCNQHPDHDTINEFRRRFLPELRALFTQILLVAREMGFLKLGNVSIDGTKVKANASKRKAVSYKRACEIQKKLEEEIAVLLSRAQEAEEKDETLEDQRIKYPEEIARREKRLEKIKEAKAVIEKRAKGRYEQEKTEYDAKVAEREKKTLETGNKPRGKELIPPEEGPRDKDQYNFTDPESRIMKDGATKSFQQSYNAQAAVDTDSMLIVGQCLSTDANDKQLLIPTLDAVPEELGQPEAAIADCGYYSEANVKECEEREIDAYIATGRRSRHIPLDEKLKELANAEPPPLVINATTKEKMAYRLKTSIGRALYRLRKMTVEPVFGIIKEAIGFRIFHLRGREKVCGEWALVCIGYNLKRLFNLGAGASTAS